MTRTKPPSAPSPSFSADDLVASLESLLSERSSGEGLSSADISEQRGWAVDRTRIALRKAHRAGRLKCGHVWRPAIDGRMRQIPVYTLVS